MEFETRRRPSLEINLSALIDIAFILVIFIVLAATFQRVHDVDVNLPESAATSDVDPRALTIRVPMDGDVIVDGVAVPSEALPSELRARRESFTSVLIVADRDASVQRAVALLADAQAAGFQNVSLATKEQSR